MRVEDPDLVSDLEQAGVEFKGEVTNEWISTVLSWVGARRAVFPLMELPVQENGRWRRHDADRQEQGKVYIEKKTGVTFEDVEGIDKAEEELMEVVEFLKTRKNTRGWEATYPKTCCWSDRWDRQGAAGPRCRRGSESPVF